MRRMIVRLAAAIAFAFTVPAAAAEADIPDADKWHVGETAGTSGVFCISAEAAAAGLALRIGMEEADAPFDAFVGAVMKLGCRYIDSVTATFRGPVEGIAPAASEKLGLTWRVVRFAGGGGEAWTWLPTDLISDRPLLPAPSAWTDGGGTRWWAL